MPKSGSFDCLSPEIVAQSVEEALGARLDGSIVSYPSYINRVFGLRLEEGSVPRAHPELEGAHLVAKFYRPGRWSAQAIREEQRFVRECAEAEIPVVAPLELADGERLAEVVVEDEEGEESSFLFSVFPKRLGRNFDAESDEDWLRLGAVIGRCHAVGRRAEAPSRLVCTPRAATAPFVAELLGQGLVHPDLREPFETLCRDALAAIEPSFAGINLQRIHGDCHRGNILDRPGEGLAIIDFDDMMTGPAVQDLWLLLPEHAESSRREIALLVEGYETFVPLDPRELALIEPLRFMRMIYFLAWRSRQRHDRWFEESHPDWGGEAFWIKELEDLREQAELIG